MTRKHVISILAACATLLASPYAQAEESKSDPTILVTGRIPLSKEKTLEVIRRATRPVGDQVARFKKPVCPRVTGFQPQYEALVEKRIRADAEAVGDDGREFVAEMHRQHPEV